MGLGPMLVGCMGDGDVDSSGTPPGKRRTEKRSYFFDLSNSHPETDFFLVSGSKHHPLVAASAEQIAQARLDNPLLQQLSSSKITHVGADLDLPDSLQICFVKGRPRASRGRPLGEWDMHTIFYHVPLSAAAEGSRQLSLACGANLPVSLRAEHQACQGNLASPASVSGTAPLLNLVKAAIPEPTPGNPGCVAPAYDNHKDSYDLAISLVCNHPEICSFHGPTLSYVIQKYICPDPNLPYLAASIEHQGRVATPTGGWATQVPYIDPKTGNPKLGSTGEILYFVQHSAETLKFTGLAIHSILPLIKNDPMLGGDVTPKTGAETGVADPSAALLGKLWVTRDGTPTRLPPAPQASASRSLLRAFTAAGPTPPPGPTFTQLDTSSHPGYSVQNVSGSVSGDVRTVTFTAENWYLRYLGLYVRFLDGAGKALKLADLPPAAQGQFIPIHSGDTDGFLSILNPTGVFLGIPTGSTTQNFTIILPATAVSMQIMAGGLGSGTNSYPNTVTAGAVLTVVLNLAIPGLFLAMAAVTGYQSFQKKLQLSTSIIIDTVKFFLQAITDAVLVGTYNDPSVFKNLVSPIASGLIDGAKGLKQIYLESLAEGEAEGVAEDMIPFGVGIAIQAVFAAGAAAQLIETSVEVARSAWTNVTHINAAHSLTVTINHDPLNTQGFPATATTYSLVATVDGGSPTKAPDPLPSELATTRTTPLTSVLTNLPYGGMVTLTVSFYSATGWLCGVGTVTVDNTLDTAAITIKEVLVPLTATTQYRAKQKIKMDADGKRIWKAEQPLAPQPLRCDNAPGNLCVLQGITVNETFASVGYAWQSFSKTTRDFKTGATGQLYQFANIAFTENPQDGYMSSGSGFPTPARLAYSRQSPGNARNNFYIDTSEGSSGVVRRINLAPITANKPGTPTFDKPGSGKAVGRFNFSSDAFLIHPTGKLISINSSLSKIEILTPSAEPVADALAPLALSCSGPGSRDGLLDGPVCAVVDPFGAILILEQGGNRIQAFDTGANPTSFVAGKKMALKPQTGNIEYLDLAIELKGYIYVLSRNTDSGIFVLDIYTPAGLLLSTTRNFVASKIAIDLFRNVFSLSFETIQLDQPAGSTPVNQYDSGITEPSVAQWIPSTPNP